MMCASKYEKPPKMTSMNVSSPSNPAPVCKENKIHDFYLTAQIFDSQTKIFLKRKVSKIFL